MGLDMYAYRVKGLTDEQVDFELPESAERIDYWRKFNNLHGWMEALYQFKGGSETFNCTPLRLMPNDLDALEAAAKARALPPTPGFFFGAQDDLSDDDVRTILAFIAKAREVIREGDAVVYDSWW